MLPSLIPGSSLLLHRIQSNRSSHPKNVQRDNALRSKIHERTERMDDMEKDIIRDVQIVSQSIKGCLTNDWSSSLLEMEDHVKFDTNRMNKSLQQLDRQIKSVDQEIAALMASDENIGKFNSNQQQQLLKLSSLESQLSTANKKFSTIKNDVKQLKLDLLDLSHSNQILRQRVNSRISLQQDLRDKIGSLLWEIHSDENKEKELHTTLSALASSSEKLEILCQQEWNHIITLIAEKTSFEESVRRFRSGEASSERRRNTKKSFSGVVSDVVQSSELDRICKVWAQCTWSNAIDTIKIESALSWLKNRQDKWRTITSEIGLDFDVDELCQWFVDHEEQNILQFEQVRLLALQRKLISNDLATREELQKLRSFEGTDIQSSSAFSLFRMIEKQTQCLDSLEEERKHTYSVIEDIKQELSKFFLAEDLPLDSDIFQNLSDALIVLEQWTKDALVELYGPFSIPDVTETELAPLQIELPEIESPSGSFSDEENPII